jgi:hypothetical protein
MFPLGLEFNKISMTLLKGMSIAPTDKPKRKEKASNITKAKKMSLPKLTLLRW